MTLPRKLRHESILNRTARDGEVSVDALAREFDVSNMTIRRDLAKLAESGRLSRFHGGAAPTRAMVVEFSFRERSSIRFTQKRAIAARAAELVSPGMAVSLDTGTTTLEVARALAPKENVTVLTTSLAIASVLHSNPKLELILLGGAVSRSRAELVGPLVEDNLKKFRVHVAFLGADAVTPDGIFTTDVQVARICRAMIANAKRAVLVADSSKFRETAFVQYAPLNEINCVITDSQCPEDVRGWLESEVKEVIYTEISKEMEKSDDG
jgi:DeoR/GlpR family transcriptional regulator of sugar metabolism